jgi:hypothetical protein
LCVLSSSAGSERRRWLRTVPFPIVKIDFHFKMVPALCLKATAAATGLNGSGMGGWECRGGERDGGTAQVITNALKSSGQRGAQASRRSQVRIPAVAEIINSPF